jgi:hypothetical protein
MEEVLVTKHVSYKIEDGILHGAFAPGLYITFDIVKQLVEDRITFCNGRTMPALLDIRGLASIDTASRKYFVTERAKTNISAGAVLVSSLMSRIAGNVFIKVDKPSIPTKLFNDKEKALHWLKQFKVEYQA